MSSEPAIDWLAADSPVIRSEPPTISLLSQIRQLRLAFLDVETTGTSPRFADRITEVGIRLIEDGDVVDYQQLVNPLRPIPPGVVALTGITQEMVDAAPTFDEIEHEVCRRLEGAVIIGHNVRFDLGFLKGELDQIGKRFADLVDCSKVLDTVRLARKTFGRRGNGLQKLAARLCIDVGTAHRALADAITTAEVFNRIVAPCGGYDLRLADVIAMQGGPCRFFAESHEATVPVGLEEAIRRHDYVRMIYLDTRNNRAERIVIPLEICRLRNGASLIAFCTRYRERRSFQLGRIVAVMRLQSLYDGLTDDVDTEASSDPDVIEPAGCESEQETLIIDE